MKYFLSALFVSLCFLFACKSDTKNSATKQAPFVALPSGLTAESKPNYQALMQMHDDAMIKLDTVVRLQKKLKDILHEENVSVQNPTEQSNEVRSALSELNKAEDIMYKWMHNFNGKMDTLNADGQRGYLVMEKFMMEEIREQILFSIEKGNKTLTKIGRN